MLIGVAAGVVVLLLLAGALLLRPPSQYDFLRSAKFDSLSIYPDHAPPTGVAKSTPDIAQRQYWLPQSDDYVYKLAGDELAVKGWTGSIIVSHATPAVSYTKGAGESILIWPAEGGGTHVLVWSPAGFPDRVQDWFWKLTHR